MFSNPELVLNQLHVDPGMKVADLGIGSGAYTLLSADRVGNSGVVYAFDIQKELLNKVSNEAVKQGLNNIKVIWSDLDEPNSTQLKEESVDRVIVTNLLFQVEDKKAIAKEAKRILKKNGKVLVVDWTESFGGLGPHKEAVFSRVDAEKLFVEEGFIIDKTIEAGEHHYGFVCKLN